MGRDPIGACTTGSAEFSDTAVALLLVNLTAPKSANVPEYFHFLRQATGEEIGVDVQIIGGLKIEPEFGRRAEEPREA